jgi:hypothetical protein
MKLQRLRRDIQVGIDQLVRGEFVEDFEAEKFLAATRHESRRDGFSPILTFSRVSCYSAAA